MPKSALGRGLGDLLRQTETAPQPPDADSATSDAHALDRGVRALVASADSDPESATLLPTTNDNVPDPVCPRRVTPSPVLRWTLVLADVLLLALAALLILGRNPGWPEYLLGACATAVAAGCGCFAWSLGRHNSQGLVLSTEPGVVQGRVLAAPSNQESSPEGSVR